MSRYARPNIPIDKIVLSEPDESKRHDPRAVTVVQAILSNNLKKKLKLTLNKIKQRSAANKKKCDLMIQLLNALYRKKVRNNQKHALALLASQSLSSILNQQKKLQQKNSILKETSVKIIDFISNKLYNKTMRSALAELKQKLYIKNLYNCYRVQAIVSAVSTMGRNKLRLGWKGLYSNTKSYNKVYKAIGKLFAVLTHKQHEFKAYSLVSIHYIGIKRTTTQQEQQSPPSSKQSIPSQKNQNQFEEQYKKLEKQLEKVQTQNDKTLEKYKKQEEDLQKKQQSLKFNYDILEQNNRQLEREIYQTEQKIRKKLPIKEVWNQIYKRFLYFLKTHQNQTISKENLIQCLESPMIDYQCDADSIRQENKVLQELLEQYKKIGMVPNIPEEEQLKPGVFEFSKLPFDVIVKNNRYLYDVVEVLTEKGLGRPQDVDTLRQQLQNLITKN